MGDSDLDFSEPWDLYDDEEEPWKDRERILELEKKMDTQVEIGDALGCTPSTISYWLRKFHDEEEDVVGEGIECRDCGAETAGRCKICDGCLDNLRERDREANYDNYAAHLEEVNS